MKIKVNYEGVKELTIIKQNGTNVCKNCWCFEKGDFVCKAVNRQSEKDGYNACYFGLHIYQEINTNV